MTATAPYVGLAPFGEGDADRFFGRDAERKRIIANLQASRFTLLYARSGVGKSSLLRAGVVARLAAAPGTRLVPFVFSSWSGDPNVELPLALGAGGDGLEPALERRTGTIDGTLLVILDQFEEFFQYHHGTPEAERFADDLAGCVQRTDLRAHFLVSIREDAYARLGDAFKGRLPNVYSNYLHLDDLDERGARAAIEGPLRQNGNAGAEIEPALVDRVLRDVRRDEATNGHARYEAAHLQYVLRRLWDEEARGGSSLLRLATLEQLGGSAAIFERHFDEAVAGLSASEQDALGQAFRFLVTSAGTKRAESAADLAELAGVPQPTLERALEHLREARILTPVAAGGQTRYELAHDLLAEPALEWRRAREKAREMRALRRTIAGLGLVAALLTGLIVWALLERGAAGRQAERAQAQALVARSVNQLSVDPERSVALARQAWQLSATPEAEDALRRALTASLVRQRLDVGTTWRGVVGNGVAVSEGPDGVHVWRGFDAGLPAKSLSGGGAVLSADGTRVAATSSEGVQAAPTDGGGVIRVAGASAPALSADGRYLAVAGRDGTVRVLDAQTGQVLARHRGPENPVLAFSGDGRLVGGDCLSGGGMVVWNWRTGDTRTLRAPSRAETTIPRGGAPTCLLAMSPDGMRVAQSLLGGSADLWDLAAGRLVASDLAPRQAVRDIAWSPDGDSLAVAAGKVATVLDRSGRTVSSTPSQVDFLTSVAFDPRGGDLIVTAGRDGVAQVWDAHTGRALAELRGHTDEISDAAFTADGRGVVTIALDGTVRSWQVVEGRVIRHSDWVLDAAFSPDGRSVATAVVNGSALVTPLDGGRRVRLGSNFGRQTANSIAFDGEGRRVAVAGGHDAGSGQIVVADASTGDVEKEMDPAGAGVLTVAFSPDGEWLVTAANDAPPALWHLSEFTQLGPNGPTATLAIPGRRAVVRAEFSPDGRWIVTAANDGVARIFDAQTHRQTRQIVTPGLMQGATFSPDSKRILTYGSDFIGRIWDAQTGRQLAVLRGHSSWISRGAFSPDGSRVVTGSADQTTRVWDSRTGRLMSTQRMHGDAVNSVAYSPDGGTILSAGDDRTARLYPCATCAPIGELMRIARDRVTGSP